MFVVVALFSVSHLVTMFYFDWLQSGESHQERHLGVGDWALLIALLGLSVE